LISKYITRIEKWLQLTGVTLHHFSRDLPCSGMYRSETREIFLNDPIARNALLTLAHEAGHDVGYMIFGAKKHSYQRERQAFVYGWKILTFVGANSIISRKEWIEADRERRASEDVQTDDFRRKKCDEKSLRISAK
jgi:hypothetical protein